MTIYNFFKTLGEKLSFKEKTVSIDPDLLDYQNNYTNATACMFYEHDGDNVYLMKHFNYTKARNAETQMISEGKTGTSEELDFKLVQQIFYNILPITKSGIREVNCQKSVHAVVKLVLEEKLVSIEALHRCLNHRYPHDNDYNRAILDKETTWLFEQGYFVDDTKLKSLLDHEVKERTEQEIVAQQIFHSIMARQLEYKLPEHSIQKVKRPKI